MVDGEKRTKLKLAGEAVKQFGRKLIGRSSTAAAAPNAASSPSDTSVSSNLDDAASTRQLVIFLPYLKLEPLPHIEASDQVHEKPRGTPGDASSTHQPPASEEVAKKTESGPTADGEGDRDAATLRGGGRSQGGENGTGSSDSSMDATSMGHSPSRYRRSGVLPSRLRGSTGSDPLTVQEVSSDPESSESSLCESTAVPRVPANSMDVRPICDPVAICNHLFGIQMINTPDLHCVDERGVPDTAWGADAAAAILGRPQTGCQTKELPADNPQASEASSECPRRAPGVVRTNRAENHRDSGYETLHPTTFPGRGAAAAISHETVQDALDALANSAEEQKAPTHRSMGQTLRAVLGGIQSGSWSTLRGKKRRQARLPIPGFVAT